MRYRAEIDGLRALAVIPVVLFHAEVACFGGGFVGVDVFFVISGYLITTIIISEIEAGKFSIMNFYERRARRILPALFFVMTVCVPVAWLSLLPQDMKSFSQSLVAVSVFASNALFWQTSGYFETAAELKPLLHTWSLAVEEQYYAIFPVLLMVAWQLGKRWLVILASLVAIASLALAQWGSLTMPAAAFYLLPMRGWELLIGVIVALSYGQRKDPLNAPLCELGGWIGLGFLTGAIFSFDKETPFPSVYTLIPTVGAALIILCASERTVVGRILGSRVAVGIGIISYSTYLWHYPLFAFTRYLGYFKFHPTVPVVLAVLSVILASCTWKYVETPLRNRTRLSRQAVFACSIIGSLVFVSFGLVGHFSDGLESNWISRQTEETKVAYLLLSEAKITHKSLVRYHEKLQDDGDCRFNFGRLTPNISERLSGCYHKYGKGVVVLGDSHATDLYGTLNLAAGNRKFLVGFTTQGCVPHIPISGCHYREFLDFIKNNNIFSSVIYEQAGFYLLRNQSSRGNRFNRLMFSEVPLWKPIEGISPNESFIDSVLSYLDEVSQFVPVLWFGPRIEPHFNQRDVLKLGCGFSYKLRDGQEDAFRQLDNTILRKVGHRGQVRYVSQIDMLNFDFRRDFMSCEAIYWVDGDHFSSSGRAYFSQRLDLNVLINGDT